MGYICVFLFLSTILCPVICSLPDLYASVKFQRKTLRKELGFGAFQIGKCGPERMERAVTETFSVNPVIKQLGEKY